VRLGERIGGPRSHQRSSGMLLYTTRGKCQKALRLSAAPFTCSLSIKHLCR
jgi:hypothetical protein